MLLLLDLGISPDPSELHLVTCFFFCLTNALLKKYVYIDTTQVLFHTEGLNWKQVALGLI